MAKLTFDDLGLHFYETGISDVVLYPQNDSNGGYGYSKGIAWNGVTSISQSPEGAEPTDIYADNVKYLTVLSKENFKGTIEAYTYPDEWEACDGSAILRYVSGANKGSKVGGLNVTAQRRKKFCLAYKTKIGNDILGDECAYKLHIIYNAQASVSEKQYQTINDSPEAITFSWSFTTTDIDNFDTNGFDTSLLVDGKLPFDNIAYIEIDSRYANPDSLNKIELMLYGSNKTGQPWDPHILMPEDVYHFLGNGFYRKETPSRLYVQNFYHPTSNRTDVGCWNCNPDNPIWYRPNITYDYETYIYPDPGFTVDPSNPNVSIGFEYQDGSSTWVDFDPTNKAYYDYDAATGIGHFHYKDGDYPHHAASYRITCIAAPV